MQTVHRNIDKTTEVTDYTQPFYRNCSIAFSSISVGHEIFFPKSLVLNLWLKMTVKSILLKTGFVNLWVQLKFFSMFLTSNIYISMCCFFFCVAGPNDHVLERVSWEKIHTQCPLLCEICIKCSSYKKDTCWTAFKNSKTVTYMLENISFYITHAKLTFLLRRGKELAQKCNHLCTQWNVTHKKKYNMSLS